ncbi:hypothetical protein AB0E62_34095 [Streptomyces sp. NPDC038707]|uniref:hypothetical protein n=1 Tax=Streptomyces sp. NPDC038707 TaxID=3154329 RepID=UPI0033DE0ECA
MTARSAVHVYVTNKDGTRRQWLQPGDEVPSWARLDKRNMQGEQQQARTAASDQTQGGEVTEPARSGKGSGVKEWRAYAEARGVTVDPDMSRDDIIAACERAGVTSSEG